MAGEAGGSSRKAKPGPRRFFALRGGGSEARKRAEVPEAAPAEAVAASAESSSEWAVRVRARGLGRSRGLAGAQRLCLAAGALALVRPAGPSPPRLALPLASVRRCGHSDAFFFLELGRSAATGPGELWMQAGDAAAAQRLHEAVLAAMRALRPAHDDDDPRPRSRRTRGGAGGPRARTASEGDPKPAGGGGEDPSPRPLFFSSSSASSSSSTPETPPGQQLAMGRGRLGPPPAPRRRTCSLTTPPARPWPLPLASASLDEYTLLRATVPPYHPYPEDYCDLEIGSGGSGPGGGAEEGYMAMSPGVGAAASLLGKSGSDVYMPMSPTSVSAPQQILQPRPYKAGRECSPEDSGYMSMWGPGARLSGESPDGRLANGDYLHMSPVLHGPSAASASPLPSPAGLGILGCGGQSSGSWGPSAHIFRSRPSSLGGKDSDQYVHMNSLAGMLIQVPKGETLPAPLNHVVRPLPMRHSQTENSLSQQAGLPGHSSRPPSHRSLGSLLPHRNEESFPHKLQSSSGDYVSLGYSVAPPASLGSGLGGSPDSPLSNYMNLNLNGSPLGTASVESMDDVLLPGSCPSPGQPDEHYLKMEMETACLSSPSSEVGDYTEMAFSTVTTLPQPISHQPESPRVASPVAGLKRLTITGVEAFLFASPPPDPNRGAKVIRADPQGRRRHSSETFSSTTTVTPVSPSFAHVSKRHNSASVENVSLRKNEGFAEDQSSSPMCRETSAGFQNGLNYIALDGEGDQLANGSLSNPNASHPLIRSGSDVYASMAFPAQNVKEAASVKE